MDAETRNKPGPKGITDDQWNEVIDLIEAEKTNGEIQEATGLGLTKICEIKRSMVRRQPQEPATDENHRAEPAA
jgi:hypothetical protein